MKRIEKEANFRRLNKQVYHIAEHGTYEDLVEWNKEYDKLVEEKALLKGDMKILEKNELFAEQHITWRKYHKVTPQRTH